jgi:putative flippase GtrA
MNNLPFSLFGQKSAMQLFRYGLVGIISNSIGFIIYLLLTHFGTTPKITMSFLYLVGVAMSYLGNRKWTFGHKGSQLGAGIRYVMAHFFGYFINLIILILFVDKLGYAHQWVQAIAIFIVAAYLFLAFKFYVFKSSQKFIKDAQ